MPTPQLKNDNGTVSENYVLSGKYYTHNSIGSELIGFDKFGIVRTLPVQNILLSPVQFNSAEGKIRIYTKITGRINFSSSQKISEPVYDRMLSSAIINYKNAAQWQVHDVKLKKGVFNSVLSNGRWFRFEAADEGIYKITKSMLAGYGIDANSVDPRTIKIYNNGGKVMPENPLVAAPNDLVENAIFVSGESDGKFDDTDFILFYGRGVNFWEYDTTVHQFVRRFNPYSKENFFWITSGGAQGKRMNPKVNETGNANSVLTTTPAFTSWDEDKINIGKSGRYFVGDEFATNIKSRSYTNKLDNMIPNSLINYNFQFINSDPNSIQLKVEDNSNLLYSNYLTGTLSDPYSYTDFSVGVPAKGSLSFSGTLPENRSVLKFTYSAASDKSKGYLDYFEIRYSKYLIPSNDQLLFFSPDSNGLYEYDLSGFSNSNISVYDITDYSNVRLIANPFISGGEYRFLSNEISHYLSRYIAVGNSVYKTPGGGTEIENSNLHGESSGAQLIIITPKQFREQALRLKNYKESNAPVKTSVVVADIDKVFNEFSGGMSDISGLRNYFRYAFLNWAVKPENVLLFGDGTYDYRNIEGAGNNYILTYQTPESFHLLHSYPMDDYFAKVDSSDDLIDLGIGRLNINSLADAQTVVDKIILYDSNEDKGDWQNIISMVADDNLTTAGYEGNYHTTQSETLASLHIPGYFTLNKIYLGAYPTVITGFGRTKPGVTEAIINSVNTGTLILNYIGHGSPELWAHERVFENSSTIPQLKNKNLFFLTAATCDFGYYDLPTVQSGVELLVLKPNSGAIAGFTASRPVFSNENAALNEQFYDNLLFSPRDSLSFPITIGESYFKTKINKTSENDKKFHLFGDPSIRLLIPRYNAVVDSINGISVANGNIQIKALSNSNVSGHIEREGSIWSGYSGEGVLSVFDSDRKVPLPLLFGEIVTYPGGVIYKGRVSISNGYFKSSFVVPKDISYENKNGKIVFFFNSENDNGIGFTRNLIVGGTDSSAVNDNKGPAISITFDDPQFKNGYLVNPDSKLIVHLSDDTGINTTGTGIGHKMEGILNDKI
ncbi:MAG: type IX secretion system sortase PorU, partial [Methanococcaceae archaeon]